MSIEDVGALGRIRNGSREPLVASRTKKLVSLPAMSHTWGVKPEDPSWSSLSDGVLPVTT